MLLLIWGPGSTVREMGPCVWLNPKPRSPECRPVLQESAQGQLPHSVLLPPTPQEPGGNREGCTPVQGQNLFPLLPWQRDRGHPPGLQTKQSKTSTGSYSATQSEWSNADLEGSFKGMLKEWFHQSLRAPLIFCFSCER